MFEKIRSILNLDSYNDLIIKHNNILGEEEFIKAEIDSLAKDYKENIFLYEFQKKKLLSFKGKDTEDVVQSNIILKGLDDQFKKYIATHIGEINSLRLKKETLEKEKNELLKKAFNEYLEKVSKQKKKSTATIIQNKDGNILLLRRHPADQFYGGTWCLPGGGIEQNENIIEAAIREVKEESGLNLKEVQLIKTYDLSNIKLYYFKSYLLDNIIPEVLLDLNEHSNYIWASFEDWKSMDLILDLKDHLYGILKPELFNQEKELIKAFLVLHKGFEKGLIKEEDFEKAKTNFKEKLGEVSSKRGGKSDNKSLIDIANKWANDNDFDEILDELKKQYEIGIKIELEHTDNKEKASDIVRDHLFEDYRYYTKSKPKDWAERELDIEKAIQHKYIKKEPDGKGGFNYIYEDTEGKEVKENINFKKIKEYGKQVIEGGKHIERLSQDEERGTIVGGRRNVEGTILVGTIEGSSQRDTKERQERVLEQYAKKEGIWFEDFDKKYNDTNTIGEGTESKVFKYDNNYVIKKMDSGMVQKTPQELFDRIAIHNFLFPEVKYELLGFTEGGFGISFLLKQKTIKNAQYPTLKEIEDEMVKRGFEKDGSLFYKNKNYLVQDLKEENVLKRKNGNLYFIDPIVKLNPENREISDEIKKAFAEFDFEKAKHYEEVEIHRDGKTFLERRLVGSDKVEENKWLLDLNKKYKLSKLPLKIDKSKILIDESNPDKHWILKWNDEKSNKIQYSYSENFCKNNAQIKWDRVERVKKKDVDLSCNKTLNIFIDKNKTDSERQQAAVLFMLFKTGLRVGDKSLFEYSGNRGISTLAKENIDFDKDKVVLNFVGKSYVENNSEIESKELVSYLKNLVKNKKDKEMIFDDISKSDLDKFYKESLGFKDFKIKDIRTYVACDLAKHVLYTNETIPPPLPKEEKNIKSLINKKIKICSEIVAQKLNNTPGMSKKSYIHPNIFESWISSLGLDSQVVFNKAELEEIKQVEPLLENMKNIELNEGVLDSEEFDECEEYNFPDWYNEDEKEIKKSQVQVLKEEVNYIFPSNTINRCESCEYIVLLSENEDCLCRKVIGFIEREGICDLYNK